MQNTTRTHQRNAMLPVAGHFGRSVRPLNKPNPVDPARTLQIELENLRREEALLQEELRQLRAAVQIYNQVITTLSARAEAAKGMCQRAA